MTLIVAFDCDHHSPVFLSDRLLSSKSGRAAIALPTIGNQHERIRIEKGGSSRFAVGEGLKSS
jgi:hypothetical protein